jgi:AraC-like DNA-binding protein
MILLESSDVLQSAVDPRNLGSLAEVRRNREPRLTVRALRPLMSGLTTLGYDPVPLLNRQGIDSEMLLDPDATMPMSVCVGLLAEGVRATGDDNLGLHVAERAELGSFDVHFYAMVSSPTLGAAFERVCRYQRLIHETSEVRLAKSGDRAVLSHRLAGGMPAPRQTAELLIAAWVRAGRAAACTKWSPAEVRFAHRAPRDSREHERFFGAPLRFGTGENALVLPAGLLDLPCRGTDPSLLSLLDRYAADRLDGPRAATFADRARAALSEEMQTGYVTAHALAARLAVSVRTLHRSLAVEGTSFRRLLDQLRLDIAERHLRDDRMSVAEVAFLVGFSELSAFHRAFKRWTGRTPVAFRAEARTRRHSRAHRP